MELYEKNIEINGMKRTRPILAYVRNHIERWIERQQSLLFFPNKSTYRVVISREWEPSIFICEIHITIGSRKWIGCESGKTLQECLEHTLGHLRNENATHFLNSKSRLENHQVA